MELEQKCQNFFNEYKTRTINDKPFLEDELKRMHYLDSNLYRMNTQELANNADYVTRKMIETCTKNEILEWSKVHYEDQFTNLPPTINATSIANISALYLVVEDEEWKEKLLETKNKITKIFLKNRQYSECSIC